MGDFNDGADREEDSASGVGNQEDLLECQSGHGNGMERCDETTTFRQEVLEFARESEPMASSGYTSIKAGRANVPCRTHCKSNGHPSVVNETPQMPGLANVGILMLWHYPLTRQARHISASPLHGK